MTLGFMTEIRNDEINKSKFTERDFCMNVFQFRQLTKLTVVIRSYEI